MNDGSFMAYIDHIIIFPAEVLTHITSLLRWLIILGIDEDHVVGDDAGGDALCAILVRDLSVVDPALDHRPLSLSQVLHDRVAERWLEHHHPVPVGALGPITGLESEGDGKFGLVNGIRMNGSVAAVLVIGMRGHGEGDHGVLLTAPLLWVHSDPAHQSYIVQG